MDEPITKREWKNIIWSLDQAERNRRSLVRLYNIKLIFFFLSAMVALIGGMLLFGNLRATLGLIESIPQITTISNATLSIMTYIFSLLNVIIGILIMGGGCYFCFIEYAKMDELQEQLKEHDAKIEKWFKE